MRRRTAVGVVALGEDKIKARELLAKLAEGEPSFLKLLKDYEKLVSPRTVVKNSAKRAFFRSGRSSRVKKFWGKREKFSALGSRSILGRQYSLLLYGPPPKELKFAAFWRGVERTARRSELKRRWWASLTEDEKDAFRKSISVSTDVSKNTPGGRTSGKKSRSDFAKFWKRVGIWPHVSEVMKRHWSKLKKEKKVVPPFVKFWRRQEIRLEAGRRMKARWAGMSGEEKRMFLKKLGERVSASKSRARPATGKSSKKKSVSPTPFSAFWRHNELRLELSRRVKERWALSSPENKAEFGEKSGKKSRSDFAKFWSGFEKKPGRGGWTKKKTPEEVAAIVLKIVKTRAKNRGREISPEGLTYVYEKSLSKTKLSRGEWLSVLERDKLSGSGVFDAVVGTDEPEVGPTKNGESRPTSGVAEGGAARAAEKWKAWRGKAGPPGENSFMPGGGTSV